MSKDYGEHLKRRARAFLRNAEYNFENGEYDLVLFHIEQFIQLYLKYLLYRKIGDYPKTHSLTRLFHNIMRIYNDRLRKLYEDNMVILYLLEESYITSRYIPREYDRDIAERVLKFSRKVLEVFECLERE